jgi:indole-3-glycerol phosphate synthase
LHPDHILDRIVRRKQEELASAVVPVAQLARQAAHLARRSFRTALTARTPAVIAEIKKASPSRGLLAADFEPAAIARAYEAGGAAALSVLTDQDFFSGSLADLESARAATELPVLRKDFTTAEYHVVEAAAHGADAILLIAAILDRAQLRAFRDLARTFQMDCLVEVHDEEDLATALESGAEIIGVNNRDLRTFEVNLDVSKRLRPLIPPGILCVAESGISTREHVHELAGFQAFLVGESLMRAADPALAIRQLCS